MSERILCSFAVVDRANTCAHMLQSQATESSKLKHSVKRLTKKLLEPEAARNSKELPERHQVTNKPTNHRRASPSNVTQGPHQQPWGFPTRKGNETGDRLTSNASKKSPYPAELVELIFKRKDSKVLCL